MEGVSAQERGTCPGEGVYPGECLPRGVSAPLDPEADTPIRPRSRHPVDLEGDTPLPL